MKKNIKEEYYRLRNEYLRSLINTILTFIPIACSLIIFGLSWQFMSYKIHESLMEVPKEILAEKLQLSATVMVLMAGFILLLYPLPYFYESCREFEKNKKELEKLKKRIWEMVEHE